MVVDPSAYRWKDQGWHGLTLEGQVLYEMHIGAFTPEGTFAAAARELKSLADLGVTCVEIMPVAEFPGKFNWGYDGVCLFAPYHGYGGPDALRHFVDQAHALQLGVLLDVVYNHLGPSGNHLPCFSSHYFARGRATEWGESINFDGPESAAVRDYFTANAAYWIAEFHLDGLRLDATQSLFDSRKPHIISEITAAARAAAAPRSILVLAENEPQQIGLANPVDSGGMGLDALWNDDFHHSARVALTGSHDGYFHDYRGSAQELLSAVRHGFLFQGQYSHWQKKARGSPALGRNPARFVTYLQNHDQVGNTFYGKRLHTFTSPGKLRALTALHLLAPQTPLLFMGQEFDASSDFCFFADHTGKLANDCWQGRKQFMRQFAHYAVPSSQECLPDPSDPRTFERSRLEPEERTRHGATFHLYRDLLRIRRYDPVISRQGAHIDGAVLSEHALLVRWLDPAGADRLLVVNLGAQLERLSPEPLLAPPEDSRWDLAWSSNEPRYAGPGALSPARDGWNIAAESATLLRGVREDRHG
jgi:maltooligosyltrehalose trehalohydrolase